MPTQRSLIIGAALLFGAVAPGCVEDSEEIGDRTPREGEACDDVGVLACDTDTDTALYCAGDGVWAIPDEYCFCEDNADNGVTCYTAGFIGLRSAQRPTTTRALRNTA